MRKGRVIAGVAALVVVIGAVTAFALTNAEVEEVRIAEATRGDLEVVVPASGQVIAHERYDLYPPTAGTLASIEASEGQRVRAGELIAVIDPAPVEIQLAQAEAAYASALAQRDGVARSAPTASDRAAAEAAVSAAWTAYEIADARYDAALAGLGGPTAADIAQAEATVAVAEAALAAATEAYDRFYEEIYLPAAEPRDPVLETALSALAFARDQAAVTLSTAKQGLAALLAASDNSVAIDAAKAACDQAYAAYLGARSQKEALARASGVSSALAAADAAIAAAEAARDFASDTLDRTRIVAPADGVLLYNGAPASLLGGTAAEIGVGSSVSPAAAPFTVVPYDTLGFVAQVDETDVARIEPGMPAIVVLDAFGGEEFPSAVERVDPESVLTPTGGSVFRVRFTLTGDLDRVLLGMNGSVDIEVETVSDVVTIPIEALFTEGGNDYVYVVRGDRAYRAAVEVGRMTDTSAEIRSGVSEGDAVIVSSVSGLDDGDRVRMR